MVSLSVEEKILEIVNRYATKHNFKEMCAESVQQSDSCQEDAINLMADLAELFYEIPIDDAE
jgi:hypothetical protein